MLFCSLTPPAMLDTIELIWPIETLCLWITASNVVDRKQEVGGGKSKTQIQSVNSPFPSEGVAVKSGLKFGLEMWKILPTNFLRVMDPEFLIVDEIGLHLYLAG